MKASLRAVLFCRKPNSSAFKLADQNALSDLRTIRESAALYYLCAFAVSVLFATLRYSTPDRPVIFNLYLVLLGLLLVCELIYLVCLRGYPKAFIEHISQIVFARLVPLVFSIAVLDWIFQHTTFGAFTEYAKKNVDEAQYVKMMLNGIFASDSIPHRFRWLTPLLTGNLNILPVSGLPTFTVFNFGCFITTAVVLIEILRELKVNHFLSLLVPVFLFDSFLGHYGARDHYLVDPATYMFFSIILWCLIDPKRYVHFSWLLPLGVLNSEKCVYWLPIVGFFILKECGLRSGTKVLLTLGPAVLVFFIPRLLLGHGLVANLTPPIHSPGNLQDLLSLPFTYVYFPFGFLTIFFVMGFNRLPFVLKIASFILIPIYAQLSIAGFAGDDKRMIAYTFIIYIPAALYYIHKLFEPVPHHLGVLLAAPLLLIAHFDYRFTLPICAFLLLTGTEIIPGLKHPTVQALRSRLQPAKP